MKYLLDTHIFIWSLVNTSKLSKQIKLILSDTNNKIFVSAVTFWEISIKYQLGNLELKNFRPDDMVFLCEEMGFEIVNLTAKESSTFYKLDANYHKDPFDRILIWQALKNNFTILSDDKNVKKYSSEGLKIVS